MGDGRSYLQVPFGRDDPIRQRLEELGRPCGMTGGQVAAALLAELVPTIREVRPRLQVIRDAEQGGGPRG